MQQNQGNILVVDDNKSILATLDIMLSPVFNKVTLLPGPNQLITTLKKEEYNLVILDMNFSAGINTGNEGIYWLKRIKETDPDISVVMITAFGDIELAVNALKEGASDFILKPWDNEKLIATLKMAVQLNISKKMVTELSERETELKREINKERRDIIGSSPGLLNIMNMVRKVARTDANVLITGENGTGKELIAREIHRLSARTKEILVTVDMGAISESLFESELFGHTKGSFTDAHENRAGKFETANKGTLFLDEIGNLSFHLQAKILAALENRQISRIGSNQLIPIDIRLICATNKNLDKMVSEGLFRQDLLYRINTIQIEIPPLRERGNDITILAEYFLNKYSRKYNKPNLKINQQANEKLLRYSWPGNIRELQHTLEKAVILSESDILRPEDFYLKTIDISEKSKTLPTLEEMERQLIHQALEINKGNYSAAAEKLGITRQTLYNKLKKMDQ
ncbi:MAG TPA: sigma-54 dependent transcriptional regulator [Bacteroidales bacterium]|jgi:DNA-binding NtrC family response regulator|nr:MAG: Transcriptional regulatory protein ZraR [Bacteroidetes bacterium ADurb.Bin145]HOU03393.1 sigma-54 dependent transcriptional regulator [Bacteroidales bacterium]HQG62448.1 sigma-54 dependent transcriptional regulator [Bacteroidales bacterium]HQK69081.1 sigma-54 dependent transcriptional regulator [Bacteroidales bacterium]